MTTEAEIAIVGAGLCGLSLARSLLREGRDVVLIEARERTGGRVLTTEGYDLGPAWIWPQNRRMRALLGQLGLRAFPQHSDGRLVFEDAAGAVRRDLSMAMMGDALRIDGGMGAITAALTEDVSGALRLSAAVRNLEQDTASVELRGEGFAVRAERAVLAMPPRLAAHLVALPDVPTWMAGQAKFVAVYDAPFWRDAGLNGDAVSHRGPLAEIHDASPAGGGEGALFGFAHPGAARQSGFSDAAVTQLARLLGPQAAEPRAVYVKDWSAEPETATQADFAPLSAHPMYRPLPAQGRVLIAGTETAPTNGGFLEGALESAELALAQLERSTA